MDEVALLQTFQRLREHLVGTVRHQTADFVETQYTRLAPVEHEEHQHRPLVTEATHHLPDGTGQVLRFNICHNILFFATLVTVIVQRPPNMSINEIFLFNDFFLFQQEERKIKNSVDLDLWADYINRRTLIMPLDTHVLTQACRLQLLTSKTASMSAAIKLTQSLAEVFPDDPLRGDFALFGYGVNNQ